MRDYTVLSNAGAAHCRLLVIASNDAGTAERTILAFRLLTPPSTPIVVRAQDRTQVESLKTVDASHLVVEYHEISQRLRDSVRSALEMLEASGPQRGISDQWPVIRDRASCTIIRSERPKRARCPHPGV